MIKEQLLVFNRNISSHFYKIENEIQPMIYNINEF